MISLVMPYYMRQAALDRSLLSIRRAYSDLEMEIVICDDGSPTPVEAPGCKIVRLPTKGHALNPCIPINRAVAVSTADVIVLSNPEIEHRTPVLQAMADGLGEDDYVMAACRDADTGQWLCASHVRPGEEGRGPMPHGSGFHFCAMLSRRLFTRAGGFDEAYREGQAFDDNDWLFRLARAGANFRLRDDLIVWHYRTPCQWPAGGHAKNRALFESRWGYVHA